MYKLYFYENGRFCSQLGGPVRTLSEVLSQIDRLTLGQDTEKLAEYVGCRWNRAGITPCHILVVDEYGQPIRTASVADK